MVSSSGLILRSFKAPADYNINHLLQPAAAFLGRRIHEAVELRTVSPQYLGAVVVCDGADAPQVQLAVTQAVAQFTGLSTDRISVLKKQPDA